MPVALPDLELRDPVSGVVSVSYLGRSGRSGWTLMTLVGLTETTADLTVGLAWGLRLRD